MKYILILGLMICSSCQKNDEKPELYWGSVSAIKNGIAWEAEIYAVENKPYNQGFDIIIDKLNNRGFHREGLYFFKIPLKAGGYSLSITGVRILDDLTGASYGTYLDDGDVVGDSFNLFEHDDMENRIEITEIRGKEIKGTFQVSFVKDLRYGEADPSAPDTIVFKYGKFHTRIVK
jgi:hypothetical protein